MAKTLTLRLPDDVADIIEELKEYFNESTSSQAIYQVIRRYMNLKRVNDERFKENNHLKWVLNDYKAASAKLMEGFSELSTLNKQPSGYEDEDE